MNDRVKKLTEEAVKLPPEERAALIDGILASLEPPDPGIVQAWADEGERRLDGYLNGEIQARDVHDVLKKHLKS